MKIIKKIKIKNTEAEVHFYQIGKKETETLIYSSTALIHPDFFAAMQAITPYFLKITEQECEENMVTITGISIGGSDENQGVTIVGQRLLSGNRVLNLVAPFTKYEDMTGSTRINIANALNEAVLYTEGKTAEDPQKQIEFPE